MKFWDDKDVRERYSLLAVVGRWYAQVLASSVAAERVFGKMRIMEQTQRAAMGQASFVYELMFRANSWLMESICDEAVAALDAAAT